jgi:hypothetical protein
MLLKFRTKSQAAITMFGGVAVALIQSMGHSGTLPSAQLAEAAPAALVCLKAAIAEHSNEPLDPRGGSSQDGDEGQNVSLAHRELPLIETLKAAA